MNAKKHYNSLMRTMNIYAEVVAIDYAIELIGKAISNYLNLPSRVIVYSDWNEVDNLFVKSDITKVSEVNAVAERIRKKKEDFLDSHPMIDLEIVYMDKEIKRYNPYFRASHNAARKVFGKGSR